MPTTHRFAALAMVLLLAGCEASTAPAIKSERPVQVQRVAFENENAAREFVGVVRARHETDLGFRVAGKIVARIVNVGDRVRAGDVVARLDPQDLQLQVESAVGRARRRDLQPGADRRRSSALRHAARRAASRRSRTSTARSSPRTKPKAASSAPSARSSSRATSSPTPNSRPTPTASSRRRSPSPARSSRSARRWRGSRIAARRKPWSRCPRPGSPRRARRRRPCGCGHDRERCIRGDACASSRRRPMPASRTYAARFTIRDADDAVAFGMTATVTLRARPDAPVARLPLVGDPQSRHRPGGLCGGRRPARWCSGRSTVASFTEDSAIVTSGVSDGDKVVTLGVQKLEAGLKVRTIETAITQTGSTP